MANFTQGIPPEVLQMLMQQHSGGMAPQAMPGLESVMARPSEDKSSAMKRALQLLLPLGLIAGGAYYSYKNIPKLVNIASNPKGITGKDIGNLVSQYQGDLGHHLERAMRSIGLKGTLL